MWKWYVELICSSLSYLPLSQLFMFWRSDEDYLFRKLKNYKQKNPFSNTIVKGLHKFSTSEFKQDPALKWLKRMSLLSMMSVGMLPGNKTVGLLLYHIEIVSFPPHWFGAQTHPLTKPSQQPRLSRG